jgi:signal peptidase I
MSKQKHTRRAFLPNTSDSSAAPSKTAGTRVPSQAAIRETIESIVIAFVLAFLFRTFEAEAFVIPTGSMAPTLMGRHKDLTCPKCGYPYQVSASEEVDRQTEAVREGKESMIASGTCPMCRYTANIGPNNPQRKSYPSYPGDRVLVSKCAYELNDPKRWDVVVFKFPYEASTNYIKRLVGLPGETVRIHYGDIWIGRGEEPFQIARKTPSKLLAVLRPVFDNDYMPTIAKYGWPARWASEVSTEAGGWASNDDVRFSTDGKADGETWIRYHHRTPSHKQWADSTPIRPESVKSQLITDFTAYDTGRTWGAYAADSSPSCDRLGLHWVGDLALESEITSESDAGQMVFELRKGGRRFQCRIDLATGVASLSISGEDAAAFHPKATTVVRGKGTHQIRFANCDNALYFWVDGTVVSFDAATEYEDLKNAQPEESDLEPVGVASVGAKLSIQHVRVLRDLYYVAVSDRKGNEAISDYEDPFFAAKDLTDQLLQNRPRQRFVDFPLKEDQFFMLGDNSTNSQDGRLWGPDYWVDRDLLIGKAICIYWPHSWDAIRTPWVDIPFPWFPNVRRMGMIR